MAISVDVIIVNWNAGDLLRRTVQALQHSERRAFEFDRVVIVDNASTDGSLDWLDGDMEDAGSSDLRPPTSDLTLPLVIIRNTRNRGFAAACNQGAYGSEADFLLFLNPDVEVEPDTIDVSVEVMARRPDVAILGVQLVDEEGRPQLSCARFPTPTRHLSKALGLDRLMPTVFEPHYLVDFDHRSSRRVDQVMGAYYFVRRDLFDRLDGFDERFFVYFEEVDFALRARNAGWKTLFCADTRAYHAVGGTTGQVKDLRLFYSLRSRLVFALKHFDSMETAVLLFSTVVIELPARLLHCVLGNGLDQVSDTIAGYRLFLRDLPSTLQTGRAHGQKN